MSAYFSHITQGPIEIYMVDDKDDWHDCVSVFVENGGSFLLGPVPSEDQWFLSKSKKQLKHLIYVLQQIEKDMK